MLALALVPLIGCKPGSSREVELMPQAPALLQDERARDTSSFSELVAAEIPSESLPVASLRNSAMPSHRRIVEPRARSGLVTFANEMPAEGLVWVGPLSGNGGRDVLIYVPPDAAADADFVLIYHFHGTYAESVERERPGRPKKEWVGWNRLEQTIAAATDVQRLRPENVALVYPLSAGKRREPDAKGWWNGAYDRTWMLPTDHPDHRDSFDRLDDDVRMILRESFGVHPSKIERAVIAEGHSAGGIALRNIAVAGTTRVGEYLFLDASFQTWADGCHEAIKTGASSARITLVITTGGIADPVSGRDPWCTTLESRARSWDQQQEWCREREGRIPRGSKASCIDLETASEEWAKFATWCEGMKNDMLDVPGVVVHRTGIPHGKQPRHFVGGLELPAKWHETAPGTGRPQGRVPSTR